MQKKKLSTLILLGIGLSTAQAQQATTATGNNASGSGGSVSYSVGQVSYNTNTGSNGSAAQGVQQPYEIQVVTGLADALSINLSFSAYPNPTTDFLTLNVNNYEISMLSFQLYDISGKLLETQKVTDGSTTISMINYAAANYFLKIYNNKKEVKTFKIIKN